MPDPTAHEEVTPENIDRLLREACDTDKIIDDAVEGIAKDKGKRLAEYRDKAKTMPHEPRGTDNELVYDSLKHYEESRKTSEQS